MSTTTPEAGQPAIGDTPLGHPSPSHPMTSSPTAHPLFFDALRQAFPQHREEKLRNITKIINVLLDEKEVVSDFNLLFSSDISRQC
jgi:hypothetical protein